MQTKGYSRKRWVVCPDCKSRRFIHAGSAESRCRSCAARHWQRNKQRRQEVWDCGWCREPFEVQGHYQKLERKYCSPACSVAANRALIVSQYPPREEVERLYEHGMSDRDVGRWFDRSNMWASRVRHHYGLNTNPSRKRVYPAKQPSSRFNINSKREGACRNCKKAGVLHLHHIVPRDLSVAGEKDLRNGVPLCPSCHSGWHVGQVNLYRDIFTEDEWACISSLIDAAWLDERYPSRPSNGGGFYASHCVNGHAWAEDNVSVSTDGKRRCRECWRLRRAKALEAA